MAFFSSLFLLFLGVLAAPQLVTSRQPDAKGIIDSITPYVGWIGIVAGVWGIWTVVDAVIHLGLIRWSLIAWLTWLGVGAVLLILGFLLGYSVLQQVFFSQNQDVGKKAEEVRGALAPFQSAFAVAAIALGIWGILLQLIYWF